MEYRSKRVALILIITLSYCCVGYPMEIPSFFSIAGYLLTSPIDVNGGNVSDREMYNWLFRRIEDLREKREESKASHLAGIIRRPLLCCSITNFIGLNFVSILIKSGFPLRI